MAENSETPQQMGPLDEVTALQELRSLGRVVKALHLQVRFRQRSEEWLQVGIIIDRLLFRIYILFISISIATIIFFWVNSNNTY